MPIKTDWFIDLNEIDPYVLLAGSAQRMMAKPNVRKDWEIALEDSQKLAQPAAIWDYAPVKEFKHDRIIMENGAVLSGGPVAEVMAGSEQIIVGVCTAGTAIGEAALAAKKNGQMMRSMFYETFGNYVVGMMREEMVVMFEEEIKSQGLHISTMLSPGESTWPINQQAELFTLVDASKIGVRLTETMMMDPVKSTSMAMGFGKNPLGSEGATNCDYCTMKDTCPASKAGTRQDKITG